MYSRADGVSIVIALVAHAAVAVAFVAPRAEQFKRPEPIEIEVVQQEPIEQRAARQPPPAAAPLPKATQTPVKVDRPTPVPTVVPLEPVVPESKEIVEAPQVATAPSPSDATAADGGVSGGAANGVAGGVAGGVKGGVAEGRPGGDAVVGPSYGADYLHNQAPSYPAIARRMHMEGTTMLRVLVSAEGRPTKVKVHASSGADALDEAAMEAVQHWTFVPARQGGTPIAAEVNVPVRFRLEAATSE